MEFELQRNDVLAIRNLIDTKSLKSNGFLGCFKARNKPNSRTCTTDMVPLRDARTTVKVSFLSVGKKYEVPSVGHWLELASRLIE